MDYWIKGSYLPAGAEIDQEVMEAGHQQVGLLGKDEEEVIESRSEN